MAIANKPAFHIPSLDVHRLHFIPVVSYEEYRMCTWFRAKERPSRFLQGCHKPACLRSQKGKKQE